MRFYLYQSETTWGPYELEQVQELLQGGNITTEVLAVVEGSDQWAPLKELVNIEGAETALPRRLFTPPTWQEGNKIGLVRGDQNGANFVYRYGIMDLDYWTIIVITQTVLLKASWAQDQLGQRSQVAANAFINGTGSAIHLLKASSSEIVSLADIREIRRTKGESVFYVKVDPKKPDIVFGAETNNAARDIAANVASRLPGPVAMIQAKLSFGRAIIDPLRLGGFLLCIIGIYLFIALWDPGFVQLQSRKGEFVEPFINVLVIAPPKLLGIKGLLLVGGFSIAATILLCIARVAAPPTETIWRRSS